MSKQIILQDQVYILADDDIWYATTDGTIKLGPAQIEDPGSLLGIAGGPTMADIARATWKRNPGDFQRSQNPWKPIKGPVAELEGVFRHNSGALWKVILRGSSRTYSISKIYQLDQPKV